MPELVRPFRRRAHAGAAAVVVIGTALAASACASSSGTDAVATGATVVGVALTDGGCAPSPASVAAGPITFQVTNADASAVSEAELQKGGVILGEKENLTPGLHGSFSLRLEPGTYTVFCTDAKRESWPFTVTGATSAQAPAPAATLLATATTGYRTYVIDEVAKLSTSTKAFTDAVRAGDIPRAKQLYAPAREHYESIEPVAESFGDLDPEIDARINDVANAATWSGFHRIERALWQDDSVAGMTTYADRLDHDVATLKTLVAKQTYQPAQLANGATELLNEVGSSKITGEEDRYSHTDLDDFQANLDGARQAFVLLQPALRTIDPALATTIAQRFTAVESALAPYRTSSGWVDYATVTTAQRRVLSQQVDALAEPLSEVAGKVA